LYSALTVRTADVLDQDLTAKARIRDRALELFARQGVAATSLRAVAKEAGVSPGLIVHHFGSKEGLCRAVDETVVRRIELALAEVPLSLPGEVVAKGRGEVTLALLRSQPVLCDYIGRALSEHTDASAALFHRLFAFARRDQALVAAGAVRSDADPFWRTMQQMLLVIGPLMMRPLIERELGGALLEDDNFERWMRANTDLLQRGLYTNKGRKKGKR
jgi:TetR/AcrR family transcriptional regulator, regulator of cefoperazone and chloramphenicol sensitivity